MISYGDVLESNPLLGFDVVVQEDEILVERRTWTERLFTLPWRPWIATKTCVVPCPIPDDKVYRMGTTLYMSVRTYKEFKKLVENQNG